MRGWACAKNRDIRSEKFRRTIPEWQAQPQIDDILDHDIEGLIVEGYSEGYSLRALMQ